jgi:hypothetical protein
MAAAAASTGLRADELVIIPVSVWFIAFVTGGLVAFVTGGLVVGLVPIYAAAAAIATPAAPTPAYFRNLRRSTFFSSLVVSTFFSSLVVIEFFSQ